MGKLVYCNKCVMPNTRPKIDFDDQGICGGCRGAEEKKEEIDWDKREKQLREIFDKHRSADKSKYDCIVPVSGGKDSIYQVHIAKNVYKMHPLCVSFRTDARTPLGEHNLQALRDMGVDHIDYTPNPVGFNKLALKSFRLYGDNALADHWASWSIVARVALKFRIPLVIWGENPEMEYGGPDEEREVSRLGLEWLRKQPILKGTKIQDFVDEDLKISEVSALIHPTEEELAAIDYTPIFLGYFLPWDCDQNVKIAKHYGFEPRKEGPIMGLYDYADLDCMNIVIHHYPKFLKFGFNRVTDNACNEIRKGRMTREEAIELVKERDGILPPREYVQHFCKRVGISEREFWETLERFRNKDIWYKDSEGKWQLNGWIGGKKIPESWRNPLEKGEL